MSSGQIAILFAALWAGTFWPAWKLLLMLLAEAARPHHMRRIRFVVLFLAYRLIIALPYVVVLALGQGRFNDVLEGIIVGVVVTGLVFSVIRFFFAHAATQLLWNVYGYVYDGLLAFYPYRHLIGLVKGRIDVTKPAVVVDLGCGTGNLLVELAKEPQLRVMGVDSSSTMIRRARRKLRHTNVAIAEDDLVHYLRRLPAASADYITMVNVLYAVPEREPLWEEIMRVLKPDGQAIITNSDRPGSSAIIKEHIRHDHWWKLLRPNLLAVGIIDALISELSKTQVFSFLTLRKIKTEAGKAGASIRGASRCYGGPSEGVNILFTLRRSNTW